MAKNLGSAANNQIFDKWTALGSFSLLVVYSLVNYDFGLGGRALLFSDRMFALMSLLAGIVLIYMGGWLKKNKNPRKGYLIIFGFAEVFILLSAVLSIGGLSGYAFPFNPIFVIVACGVLLVEAVFVWRLSIRGGRKALV